MFPHDSLERYFVEIEAVVAQLPAYTESYVEEILTAVRANLRIRLRFKKVLCWKSTKQSSLKMVRLKRWGTATICRAQTTNSCSDTTTLHISPTCQVIRITNI